MSKTDISFNIFSDYGDTHDYRDGHKSWPHLTFFATADDFTEGPSIDGNGAFFEDSKTFRVAVRLETFLPNRP